MSIERTAKMIIYRCCETCLYDLGGGYNNCRINLEAECAEGGYEAWEPRRPDSMIVQFYDEIVEWEWEPKEEAE